MALITLFLPVAHEEVKQQEQNIHDKRDRIETKHKRMNTSLNAMREYGTKNNLITRALNEHLNKLDIKFNPNGGYSVVSVTPVLETKAEKVDADEPMMPFVTTTGFMIILHKAD
tara:strand:- start:14429 stop:14770 length:342 start_codon:yes stop_codon:yes gene_type:complete